MCLDCCLSILSDSAGSAASCILERLWSPIERQILYLVRYRSNLKTLRERTRKLESVKIDVLRKVDDAKDKGEEIKAEVLNWHVETIQIEMDVEWLEEKIEKSKGCCHKWYLDCCSRHRLGRRIKKKTEEIDAHLREEFEIVSIPAHPADSSSLPTSDIVPLEHSLKVLNYIIELLKDERNNINIIGVYGNGGIGKTTLMKQLAIQVNQQIAFDKVIPVRVTQTPNLRMIQDTIAASLGFKIDNEDEYQRAITLSKRLKQKKRVCIILDDLWKRLSLADIGIPYGQDHMGCKIVVTSRFVDVCNQMESNRNIPIAELTDQDRLKLFLIKAAFDNSMHSKEAAKVVEAAKMVVIRCGRLPHSIVIVARALRNKPVKEWNDTIRKVRDENADVNIEEIPEEEFLCITIGYNELKTEAKGCLQFSCLFPPYYNVSMEELVIYGLVDRVFPNTGSLEKVWNKIYSVVELLRSSNLLLEGDKEGCYRVHDNTRIVVKYNATKEQNNLIVEAGLKKGWPKEDLQECRKLSLMDSNVATLPDRPNCPKLVTLFLQNNALENVPNSFFHHMIALTSLDLSYTNISSLPTSLECLVELRSLRLENTHLKVASLIKKFDQLQVLILKGSSIEQLPKGLEGMVNLKLLDLSNNLFLEGIPSNEISKLFQLEELYIGNSFGDWEVEGTANQKNAGFSEVASLGSLTVLHIHIKKTEILFKDFEGPWKNLKRFRICVNDDYWDIASPRSLHLKNLSRPFANWVKLLLEKTEHLTLTRSRDFKDIGEIHVQGLTRLTSMHLRACNMDRIFLSSFCSRVQNLEELHVEYCYSLKEVFFHEIEEQQAGLISLRELILVGLPKLLTIWKGNHSAAKLENLKLMKVKDCGKLRNLFSNTLAQRLQSLEHLAILKCDSMEEIVSNDNAEVGQVAAQEMNSSSVPPSMFFQTLQKLVIYKCSKMKSVLSLTVVQGLKQLKELNVASCNQMKVIICVSNEEKEAEKRDMLPELKILVIKDLPKLDTIYNGKTALEWRSLEELQVWKCPNVKRLPLDSLSARNLQEFRAESAWFEELQWEGEYVKDKLKDCLIKEERE